MALLWPGPGLLCRHCGAELSVTPLEMWRDENRGSSCPARPGVWPFETHSPDFSDRQRVEAWLAC